MTAEASDERRAWIALQMSPDGTPRRCRALAAACGGAAAAVQASEAEVAEAAGLDLDAAARWRDAFRDADVEREIADAAAIGARLLVEGDPEWPASLRFVDETPVVLYVRGALAPGDAVAVAIVGSRRATPYGLLHSRRLAHEIAAVGATVVSGLARGVDAEAHRGAIDAGGRTIAVLGCGIDVTYPPEHRRLRDDVVRAGAVVTEFPLGTPPLAHHFPRRNRIVSGLSLGVIVVEAALRSGSLVTVDWALAQGREVFGVPGPIDSPLSAGVHRMLRDGAALLAGIDDLARELPAFAALVESRGGAPAEDGEAALDARTRRRLGSRDASVLEQLSSRPVSVDFLVDATGYPASLVAATLTSLELSGLAVRVTGGDWVRSPDQRISVRK
jgi:DNA processing protein